MEEKTLQAQVAELTQKVDLLLDYVNQQRLRTQMVEDLVSDVAIVGKDIYDSAVEDLDKSMVTIDPPQIKQLAMRFLRNIDNFNTMLETLESASDFVKDAAPIVHDVALDLSRQLDEFERKGYFAFLLELKNLVEASMQHFSADDLRNISANMGLIASIMRNLSNPKLMEALNNSLEAVNSMHDAPVPSYSAFKAMRSINNREVKSAFGFLFTFLKNLDSINNKKQLN